ncbi:MAG: hypothetical protein MI685_02215 [Chlorobiales bacterium]|nr:hypothetical protein [Chlorobiales bacterium]
MTQKTEYTLQDFFDSGTLSGKKLDKLGSKQSTEDPNRKLLEKLKGLKWSCIRETILEHLNKILDISIADILVSAWQKNNEIKKYAQPDQYPEGETFLVPLLEHTITSRHEPSLELSIDNLFRETIPFTINLELVLKGFDLEIAGGKIMKVHTGKCWGKGSVHCIDIPVTERKSKIVQLPGTIELGEGIKL